MPAPTPATRATRSLGFATQGLAALVLLLGALGGVIWALLGHPPF